MIPRAGALGALTDEEIEDGLQSDRVNVTVGISDRFPFAVCAFEC